MVKMSKDIVSFKKSFQSALLQTIKTQKDIVFLYDSNHLDDVVYIDYISNYINLFDRDSIELFDKDFCAEVIATQKQFMEDQAKQFPMSKSIKKGTKDTYLFENGQPKELADSEYYTLAIAQLSSKFHIAILVNGLQGYYDFNRNHLLEAKISCIFLEDVTNEDCLHFADGTQSGAQLAKGTSNLMNIAQDYFSKMQLFTPMPKTSQEAYQEIEIDTERKTKVLAKRVVEIKSKVHNHILDYYKTVTSDNIDEKVVENLTAGSIPNEDLKLETIAGLV